MSTFGGPLSRNFSWWRMKSGTENRTKGILGSGQLGRVGGGGAAHLLHHLLLLHKHLLDLLHLLVQLIQVHL